MCFLYISTENGIRTLNIYQCPKTTLNKKKDHDVFEDITLIDILYKEVVFYNDMVIDFYFHVWFIKELIFMERCCNGFLFVIM